MTVMVAIVVNISPCFRKIKERRYKKKELLFYKK